MTRSPRPNYGRVNGIHDTRGPYDYSCLGPHSRRQKGLNSNKLGLGFLYYVLTPIDVYKSITSLSFGLWG